MSAFDQLERQLLHSVGLRARRGGDSAKRTGLGWRRRLRPRRGLLLIAISLVFVAGATAATIVTQSHESASNRLFNSVIGASGHTAACRISGPRRSTLSNEAPDPRITAVLPELASPPHVPPSAAVVALAESRSGGTVLARTIRLLHLHGGFDLIVYVAHGEGPFTLVEPRRCLAARLAALARLRPRAKDPLRRSVAAMLANMPETDPATQSLTIAQQETSPGHQLDGGDDSFPLEPDSRALATGILYSSAGCEARRPGRRRVCSPVLYGGIAKRSTAYLTLQPAIPKRHGSRIGLWRRIEVTEGFFAFTIPRNAPREIVVQRAGHGAALAVSRVQ